MKLQYLGDSKDSFEWDYHDYLASELKYPCLNVALMLTANDGGGDGRTKAESFPARTPVLRFCRDLQISRGIAEDQEPADAYWRVLPDRIA